MENLTTNFNVKGSTDDRTSCVELSYGERHDVITTPPGQNHYLSGLTKKYCRTERRTQRGYVLISRSRTKFYNTQGLFFYSVRPIWPSEKLLFYSVGPRVYGVLLSPFGAERTAKPTNRSR